MRQLRSMGSLEGVLDMIPGGGALKSQVAAAGRAQGARPQDTEQEVKKMEAIILSMTPRERAHPEVIDGARKRRIARGSGLQPADVNRVLKARDTMQKLAKQLGAVNRKGKAVGLPRLFGKGGTGWSRSG
jgi:signal recognition particle subunit SRP54